MHKNEDLRKYQTDDFELMNGTVLRFESRSLFDLLKKDCLHVYNQIPLTKQVASIYFKFGAEDFHMLALSEEELGDFYHDSIVSSFILDPEYFEGDDYFDLAKELLGEYEAFHLNDKHPYSKYFLSNQEMI